ncbi:MAG TPA: hypothetical protein DDX84_01040, partial [Nitrospiraceae bacterium]|nr:hypothetical protein [Nitrospiraceae bacterium]
MRDSIQHNLYRMISPSILLGIILMLLSITAFARVSGAWVSLYNSGGSAHDTAVDVAYDSSGNVYVTGVVDQYGTSQDFLTIKYNASGSQLWAKRYNGPNNVKDTPYALAVDASGNVYVTGTTYISETFEDEDYDYITIKYDTNGNQLWVRQYNSNNYYTTDSAHDIEVDSAGNVYVTGYGGTVKYDTNGTELWSVYLRGYDLALDAGGNVYVVGNDVLQNSWASKLDTDGNYIWGASISYNWGHASIALDDTGNVYVRSYVYVYKFDAMGNQLWQFACTGDNAGCIPSSYPWTWWIIYGKNSFTVDASGNVYMTGSTEQLNYADPDKNDIETIKLDTNGNLLWVRKYNGPTDYHELGNAIAIDNAGGVYVAGAIINQGSEEDFDFVTIKYDSNGNQKWVKEYSGKEYYADEFPLAIEVDGKGNIYIAGGSYSAVWSSPDPPWGSGYDYVTIKYTQSDLVMTALSTTTAVAPGKTLSLSNTVKNQGGESAGSFNIAFHLSTDAVYGGTNDI